VRIAIAGEAPCELAPIRIAIRRAVRPYGLPRDAEVQVAFISDTEMRVLNKRFRRIDKTTDVLSFGEAIAARDRGPGAVAHIERRRAENGGRFNLGDVLISPEQAARQARKRRKPIVEEVAFLAAHGVLHLLGYEDETPAGYREMVRLGQDAASKKSVKQ
jgi:probable rRNA maturation factor